MKLSHTTTDSAVLEELGHRIAQYRINREYTQARLATMAGIGKRTLERIEAGESVQALSLIKVLRQLELLDALDHLLPKPGPRPMDLLKLQGRIRKRAPRTTAARETTPQWTWEDEQ